GDESHRRALHRLGDCFGIAEVVLLPLRIGPHIFRRHQSGIVAVRVQFPAQVMRTNACLLMPIRHGGTFASRASTWALDLLCRSRIAPRSSRPTTWNEFFPMSMPIVATVAVDLVNMAVLLQLPARPSITLGRGRSTAGPFH